MQQITTRLVFGIALEAVLVAVVMATAMTTCVSLVSWNTTADNPSALQIVLLVLNFPALIFYMGGANSHTPVTLFLICVFLQWLVLGGVFGLLVALVRRAMRKRI